MHELVCCATKNKKFSYASSNYSFEQEFVL
jgi:hypothetical protein